MTSPRAVRSSRPAKGLACAAAVMALAAITPALTGVNVRVGTFPPLLADWRPRVGVGTVPALVLAALVCWGPVERVRRLPWGRFLLVCYLAALAWMTSLALVDGTAGIAEVFENKDEYLPTARITTDVGETLHAYIGRIPAGVTGSWPIHIAGHPPGPLLFFIGLARLGLGSGLAAGVVVILIAATTPLAVAVTLRSLGAEPQLRSAMPFLVVGPSAMWQAVSADAMFAAVVAWGIAALALGAVRRSTPWSVLSGLLLGYGVMLSYGLPLEGLLALAVLLVARTWRPVPAVIATAMAVVLGFAVAGFAWWSALPALHDRYWAGIAGARPNWYWVWGNLAVLLFCAGPVLGAGLACGNHDLRAALTRPSRHVIGALVGAAVAMVLLADASLMSKSEVERIWLPFVPWLLLSTAWLPRSWARPALIGQVVFALLLQHLLWSRW